MKCCNLETQQVSILQHDANLQHHSDLLRKPQTGSKQAVFLFFCKLACLLLMYGVKTKKYSERNEAL